MTALNDRDSPIAVVGIGASAGGLHALEDFFSAVPSDTDLAFVVVTHQRHDTHSMLPDLLARVSELKFVEAQDGAPLAPGLVYVAVGDAAVRVEDGHLKVWSSEGETGAVIDRFFRALAEDLGQNSIGVLLSGAGSDGSVGAEAINAALGLVMAQAPEDAEYADMPANVIASGVVDYSARASELPGLLQSYVEGPYFGASAEREIDGDDVAVLASIFERLKRHTGTDFGEYKQTTIRRRLERRLNVRGVSELSEYLEILEAEHGEVETLFRELLIGVTSFFRDPEMWEALETEFLPPLIEAKEDGDTVRAWVPACSTGEEAFSLAIVLLEVAEGIGRRVDIQIFGTDVNPDSIEKARRAVFGAGIAADLRQDRLERYFIPEDGKYRATPRLRDRIVFAPHDVLADPPFSELDIISCRNLLIYLRTGPRHRLLPIFHYALVPGGILFLGPSESLAGGERLFDVEDKKARIFRRREVAFDTDLHLVPFRPSLSRGMIEASSSGRVTGADRILLDQLLPPAVLCNLDGSIIHIHGRTGRFLEPSPGSQATVNLLDMAREGLRHELTTLLHEAWERRPKLVRRDGVSVRTNGDWILVDLLARGVQRPEGFPGQIAVTFVKATPVPNFPLADDDEGESDGHRVEKLRAQLQHVSGKRQVAVEELEIANQELRSMNEELQSTNEELQSSNEELKTSKEEVQSLNEELRTVNSELQRKVEMLARSHDDMKNLLNTTDIASLFLDNDLYIKRFTDRATRIISLIPSDVERNIRDLSMRVDAERLISTAEEVLETLQVEQLVLEADTGAKYMTRIMPYRTAKNVIDGLVITFFDITELTALQSLHDGLLEAIEASPVAVSRVDEQARLRDVTGKIFGLDADEVLGRTYTELLDAPVAAALETLTDAVADEERPQQRWIALADGRWAHVFVQRADDHDADADEMTIVTTTVDTLPTTQPTGEGDHGTADTE